MGIKLQHIEYFLTLNSDYTDIYYSINSDGKVHSTQLSGKAFYRFKMNCIKASLGVTH